MSQPIPSPITEKLAAFRRRERGIELGRGLAQTLVVFVAGMFLGAAAIWLFKPAAPGRVALTVSVLAATALVFLWRVALPSLRKSTLSETAERFERAAGGSLRERLTSAVGFAESPPRDASPWMFEKTIALAAAEIEPLKPEALIDDTPLRRARRAAGAAVAILALGLFLAPWRLWVVLSPSTPAQLVDPSRLTVTPGDTAVPVGGALEIKALLAGESEPAKLSVTWEDGVTEELAMDREGSSGRFAKTISGVARPFRYRVTAGEVASPEHSVTLIEPPGLESLALEVSPPAYLKLPPRAVKGGSADILAGSRVKVMATLGGSAVKAAEFLAKGAEPRSMTVANNAATLELEPTADLNYGLHFTGLNGTEFTPPDRWTLRLVPDRDPVVTMTGPGLETGLVGSGEALLLEVEAQDDFGVSRVELVAEVGGKETRQAVETREKKTVIKAGAFQVGTAALDLAGLGLQLGDEVTIHAEAFDAGGKSASSKPVKLTVQEPAVAEAARLAARLRQVLAAADGAIATSREARSRWQGFLRTRNTRGEEALGDLELVRQSAERAKERLVDTAALLDAERRDTRHRIGPYLADLSTALAAWAEAQHRVTDGAVSAVAAAPAESLEEEIVRCRNIMDKASEELAVWRARIAVAPAYLESECFLAGAETSRGAFRRALPVVASARNWNLAAKPGMDVTFHRGRDLGVEASARRTEFPEFENRDAPSLGQTNWAARYTGEIRFAGEGPWEFTVTANDGVRVILDGMNILPEEAWGDAGQRVWKASPSVTAGWHPLTVEFFQSNGPNRLQLRLCRPGKTPEPVQRQNLRTLTPASAAPEPAGITPALVFSATSRLRQALESVTRISPEMDRWLLDVPAESLRRLADDRRHFGPDLEQQLATFDTWEGFDAAGAQGNGEICANTAGDAHRILKERWEHETWQVRRLAQFTEMRVPLQALKQAADRLRPLENDRRTAQSQEKRLKEGTVAKAWTDELDRATKETARKLFEDARDPSLPLARRAEALETSLRLDKEAGKIVEEARKAVEHPEQDIRSSEPLDRAAQKLDELLGAQHKLERLEKDGELAKEAREALRGMAKKDPANQAEAAKAAAQAVDDVADEQRRQRKPEDAAALEKAAAKEDKGELVEKLKDIARKANPQADSIGEALPPPLKQAAEEAQKNGTPTPESTGALAKARLGLALEAERLAKKDLPKTAEAYRDLGDKLGEALKNPEALGADKLKPLADKAAELVGQKDKEAQERALAAASQPSPNQSGENQPPEASPAASPEEAEAASLAQELGDLAREASQAKSSPSKRQPVRDKLDPLAKTDPSQASEARQTAAQAAAEAAAEIDAAPKSQDSFQQASKTLADAAASMRLQKPSDEAGAAAEAAEKQMAKGKPGEGKPGDKPGDKPGEEGQAGKDPKGKKPGSKPEEGDYAREAGHGISSKELAARQQAAWAALRAKLPDAVKGGDLERFDEEQQEAIRAYFKRIAENP